MLKKDRYHHILSWFEANQPEVQTELRYGSPFQLLVAVILSAQCTDRRVNMVTPELFRRFPAPEDLAGAPDFNAAVAAFESGVDALKD